MTAFALFLGVLVVLGIPTAIVLAADATHSYRQWRRDRRRRAAKLKLDDTRWS